MSYDAVVFDHDGVLVDLTGTAIHRDGARAAFDAVGVADPDPEHVEAMSIGVTVGLLEEVCGRYDLDRDEFWTERDEAMARGQCAAIRAGEKVVYGDVDILEDIEVPMGIVSSNQLETVRFSLSHFDLDHLFETVHAREPRVESLRRKKPKPYYLEAALADLGTREALFVGDSDTDIEAAERVGIDSAFIRRPHRSDHSPEVKPTYEIDGLADLLALV